MVERAVGLRGEDATLVEEGGFDGAVAEELLEGAGIQARLEGIAGEGMPERHGADGRRQPGATDALVNDMFGGADTEVSA